MTGEAAAAGPLRECSFKGEGLCQAKGRPFPLPLLQPPNAGLNLKLQLIMHGSRWSRFCGLVAG